MARNAAFLLSLLAAASPAHSSSSGLPPRVTIKQLRAASRDKSSDINLHRLLRDSGGILRIAVDDDNGSNQFSTLRRQVLGHLCDCPTLSPSDGHGGVAFEEALASHPKDLQRIDLPDGTVRRTLATATVGFDDEEEEGQASALELPSWVEGACGADAYESFEDLRDVVADVVGSFVGGLDRERNISSASKTDDGVESYRQVLSGANHLEHFHVYTKPSRADDETVGSTRGKGADLNSATLDYHTDAGFFLSFVPAMDCRTRTTDDNSFFLKGREEPLAFEEDEVIVMMGAGAQHWLPHGEGDGGAQRFTAASHALRLSDGVHRSWYGKMHILPASMMPDRVGASFQLTDYDAHVPDSPVDGCGITASNQGSIQHLDIESTSKKRNRRRLKHVDSPEQCDNVSNFFCWKQCLEIPEAEFAEQYVQEGYSLYCLDPGKLSSSESSIKDATDPCFGGEVHNSNCLGFWKETNPDVPGYAYLPYKYEELEEEEESSSATARIPTNTGAAGEAYCYGGTSMYMDGFNWQGTTCVVYLFQSWILSTPAKFAVAAIGTIIFGIAMEFVLWKRRSVYSLPAGMKRLLLSSLVYGLQLTMGYLIMLVVMTYSAPLFICCIGGMMVGHASFNAQDSLVKQHKKKQKAKAKAADEADAGNGSVINDGKSSQTELSAYQKQESYQNGGGTPSDLVETGNAAPGTEKTMLKDKKDKDEGLGGDGVTPCCQYYVDSDDED